MKPKLVRRVLITFNLIVLVLFALISIFLYSELGKKSIGLIVIIAIMIFIMMIKCFIIKTIFESNSGLNFNEALDRLISKSINIFK